ncbi:MAG: hypothetical protein IJH65_03500 [Methanobrevibacter sp.]|nr:hypothetical protein [Methanobrevibacter sp.]
MEPNKVNDDLIIYHSLLLYRDHLHKLRVYGSETMEYSEILDLLARVFILIKEYGDRLNEH